jgi:MYXO-CTERM domain-containing protein
VNTGTGETARLPSNACVRAPGNAGSATTTCYEDECVPPGAYAYGYQIPPFIGCNGTCVGPTSGEAAIAVRVTNALSNCTPAFGADTSELGSLAAPWLPFLDGGVVDGSVLWRGTCTSPLEAGACEGFSADGGESEGACSSTTNSSANGAGPTAGSADASTGGGLAAPMSAGSSTKGSGCSIGVGGAASDWGVPLVALAIAPALRLARRRFRAPATTRRTVASCSLPPGRGAHEGLEPDWPSFATVRFRF